MRVDRKLNFVIPIERENNKIFVHATPISVDVFESYYLVLAKTFNAIWAGGLGVYAGPRIASLHLKKIAKDLGIWEGEEGVERGLMNEIHRLTNVIVPGIRGWEYVQFHEAIKDGLIDSDEASEVENAIVFFTVISWVHKKSEQQAIFADAGRLWGAQTTSLDVTAYVTSLQTSMQTVNIGKSEIPVAVERDETGTEKVFSVPF